MIWFAPRPTSDEVNAKYHELGGATSSTVTSPTVTQTDLARSKELLRRLSPWINSSGRVLDFGGGTGSLMAQFVRAGHPCSLVDYSPEAVVGVERLGATLADVAIDDQYDLIVASHVIEHVPEPFAVVSDLADRLSKNGVLYVEVPMEIVGGPKMREPVTHLNFFSEAPLAALLRRVGLDVLSCEVTTSIHANGSTKLAVCAIARPGGTPGSLPTDSDALERVRSWVDLRDWRQHYSLARHYPQLWTRSWQRVRRKLFRSG